MDVVTVRMADLDAESEAVSLKLFWSATGIDTAAATDMARMSVPDASVLTLRLIAPSIGAVILAELDSFEHEGFQGVLSDLLPLVLARKEKPKNAPPELSSAIPDAFIELLIRDPSGNTFCSVFGDDIHLEEERTARSIAEEKLVAAKPIDTTVDVSAYVKSGTESTAVEREGTDKEGLQKEKDDPEEEEKTAHLGEIGCGVGRFELQETDWKEGSTQCHVCEVVIRQNERRYHCMECAETFICTNCFDKDPGGVTECPAAHKSPHEHRLVCVTDSYTAVKKTMKDLGGGIGVQIHAACVAFAERQCIGSSFARRSYMLPKELNSSSSSSSSDKNGVDILSTVVEAKQFFYFTYDEVLSHALKIASGLQKLLISLEESSGTDAMQKPKRKKDTKIPAVALFMRNCCEWAILDIAIAMTGAVIVPIDPGVTKANLEHILATTDTAIIVVEESLVAAAAISDVLSSIAGVDGEEKSFPHLKHIVQLRFDSTSPAAAAEHLSSAPSPPKHADPVVVTTNDHPHPQIQIHDLQELATSTSTTSSSISSSTVPVKRRKTDIFTLIFTSGSTGNPKGAIQTHEIWAESSFDKLLPNHPVVEVLYRPLSYATDREAMWLGLGNGGRMTLYDGPVAELFESLAEIGPTTFSAPPRIWNTLYDRFVHDVTQLRAEREDLDADVTERKVLRKFSRKMGHRVRMIGTGSAPIRPEVYEFLEECFMRVGGIPVYESYGTTEAGGISLNGYLYSGVQLMLLNVPSMGFMTTNTPCKQGEICVISGVAMPGYWKNATASTALYFVDSSGNRWCRTGDIGEVRDAKLYVIDRIANLVKLANGVFYSPEHLEGAFQLCESVKDIFVYGHSSWEFPLVAIYPTEAATASAPATEAGGSGGAVDEVLLLQRRILKEMRSVADGRDDIPKGVVPRGVLISDAPFTVENRLLTISMKPSRPNLRTKFLPGLQQMYADLTGQALEKVDASSTKGTSDNKSKGSKPPSASSPLLAQVLAVYKATLRQAHIDAKNDSAKSLGADSISIALLREKLKGLCGLQMHVQELWGSTVAHVVAKVEATLTGQAGAAADNDGDGSGDDEGAECCDLESMINNDIAWTPSENDEELAATAGSDDVARKNPTGCFITGATGFIGRHVLKSFLRSAQEEEKCEKKEQPQVSYCLVRCGSEEEGALKLHKAFSTMTPNDQRLLETALTSKTVVIVRGDLAPSLPVGSDQPPPLGIDPSVTKHLQEKVSLVIHAGAHVNHTLPYSELRAANVDSTRALLNIFGDSTAAREVRFVFLSSASVAQYDKVTSPISHNDTTTSVARIPDTLLEDDCGYIITKWVCEQMLQRFANASKASKNRNVSILRVGMTSWCTETGVGNSSDWLCQVALAVKSLGAYPAGLHSYDLAIAPVDWLADVIVNIASVAGTDDSRTTTSTLNSNSTFFNVSSPRAFDASQLYEQLGAERVDRFAWTESLKELAESEEDEQAARAARAIVALFKGSIPGGERADEFDAASDDTRSVALSQSLSGVTIRGPMLAELRDERLLADTHSSKFAAWLAKQAQ